ncbi:MAG: DUF2975 domain-containing protein [Brevibacterium sp.]|uniref:DUF2975 domain-containing protein n=1 Tax=Brevibacterium sandarakinum TaxID=629680 RepID=UPI0026508057|nr:DUF2975 domain-containing protein [Brevibacterium sandarakinum]MDN5587896.1 DUF2975 domain-containing protein [Brevibacterium sp.]MDN5657709.1 DUF2975 domain-containing protein [Brevibacterium sandarakinum]
MTQARGRGEQPDENSSSAEDQGTVAGNLKGGMKSGDEAAKRKAFGTGYELWVGLAIGFYVIYAVTELITDLVHAKIRLPLEFESDSVATLDFPGAEATLSGLTQITVSTPDLATETMVLLLIAKIALILTFIVAAVASVPVIRDIAKGDAFTGRSITALGVLESVIAVGWLLYFGAMVLGSNMVSRDLDIADDVGPGVSTVQAFLLLGVVGGIELLRRCFKSGQKAQEELEGLV